MKKEKLAEEIAKIYMVDLNKRLEYDLRNQVAKAREKVKNLMRMASKSNKRSP